MMPAVFILPEDIQLTAGPASFHRQFLDIYISQYSRPYLNDLIGYRKIIMQRNKLLKDIIEKRVKAQALDAWDDLLTNHAERIIEERIAFVESILDSIKAIYSTFDSAGKLEVEYESKIDIEDKNIREAIVKQLANLRDRELRAGLTLVGPHRDRLLMNLNGRSIRHYGSRGQKRVVMLSIKLAVADYLSHIYDRNVVLILDEAFAELDKAKSLSLMTALANHKQVFIATAGELDLESRGAKVFRVDDGRIEEVES